MTNNEMFPSVTVKIAGKECALTVQGDDRDEVEFVKEYAAHVNERYWYWKNNVATASNDAQIFRSVALEVARELLLLKRKTEQRDQSIESLLEKLQSLNSVNIRDER